MSIEETFWSKVEKSESGCWLWAGTMASNGYGRFQLDRKSRWAHRVAYQFAVSPIPEGLCVLHRCDNPPCVNPEHLFLGTQQDNLADMVAKGRNQKGDRHSSRLHPERLCRGERHGQAKLTEASVLTIRAAYRAGGRVGQLARQFGVARQTITDILRNRRWTHLPSAEIIDHTEAI